MLEDARSGAVGRLPERRKGISGVLRAMMEALARNGHTREDRGFSSGIHRTFAAD
jgi:hypothetical protein